MNEITTTRSNALIDPALHVWGHEIPLYLFLGGLVAGLMILNGLWMMRRPGAARSRHLALLPWAGPLLLSVGMAFLWLDLEHPFNAYRFYLVLRPTSPMSWGAWILLVIYPASIALAWAGTPTTLRQRWLERSSFVPGLQRIDRWAAERVPFLSIVNIALGAALGIYTGVLLGTMAARPLWNSAILGPLFLVSGLSTGAAFMLLHRLADSERKLLGRLDMGLIAVELAIIALWLIGLASGGQATRAAAWIVLGGPYTAAFWTMVIALGLAAPLLGEWMEFRHRTVPGRLPAMLVLLGGFALRWIVVSAGQQAGFVTDIALR